MQRLASQVMVDHIAHEGATLQHRCRVAVIAPIHVQQGLADDLQSRLCGWDGRWPGWFLAHGTAFDIVGKGIASTGALEQAVRLAARLALSRRQR